MTKSIDVIKHNVKILSENNPEVKECYNLLLLTYWERFELAESLNDLKRCTPAESITRAFRSLVKKGEIVLPEEIKRMRKEKRKEYHNYYVQEVEV